MRHKSVVYFLILAIALEGAGCAGKRTVVRGQNPEVPVVAPAQASGQAVPSRAPLPAAAGDAPAGVAKAGGSQPKKAEREGWLHRKARRLTCIFQSGAKDRQEAARITIVAAAVVAATAAIVAAYFYLWYTDPNGLNLDFPRRVSK